MHDHRFYSHEKPIDVKLSCLVRSEADEITPLFTRTSALNQQT